MEDEWTKVISGDRLVKFTYVELPGGEAFLIAQIAGHPVVYSVLLPDAEQPFTRAGVEHHFRYECPPNCKLMSPHRTTPARPRDKKRPQPLFSSQTPN
jgi:hypothetical protein